MAVKDVLTSGSKQAQATALEKWQAFRAESPYFQAKVGLVALYAVIVVATLLLAPPSEAPWRAEQKRIPFGLAFKTALEITNVSNGEIEDAVIEVAGKGIEFDGRQIPGVWRTKPMLLVEGLPTQVLTEQLADKGGVPPPYSLVVDRVTIYDDDKDVLVVLHPPPPSTP